MRVGVGNLSNELQTFYYSFSNILTRFIQMSTDTNVPYRAGELKELPEIFSELRSLYRKYRIWPENLKGPVSTAIDVTYRCNYNCPYCYLGCSSDIIRRELSKEEIFNVIDELAKLNVLVLCLCGGEPTLRRDLFDIIQYANEKGIDVNMVTNGSLISDNFTSKLAESGIAAVQVSLDGSRPEIMEKLRPKGSYNRAVNAIRNLIDYNIPTIVSFCSTKINIDNFPETVELCDKLEVLSVRTMYFVPETFEHVKLMPTDDQYRKLITWISEHSFEYSTRIEFGDPTEHIIIGPYVSLISLSISAEGYIFPTPYLSLAYGHVSGGIEKLWREGLEYVWRDNPVFLTISSYLKTERDFLKLKSLSITRISPNYLDVSQLDKEDLLTLARNIREVLST
ncbi:MAG TPA: radical SAM protein [Thermococcaceae archaeon]|nr:radical SAM protein [Thermococcaceae archaeon]